MRFVIALAHIDAECHLMKTDAILCSDVMLVAGKDIWDRVEESNRRNEEIAY